MRKEGGSGEPVLESRHVVGMFLAVIVLCGVFFSLGYVMGRTQFDASLRAAAEKPAATPSRVADAPAGGAATPAGEWNSSPAATPSKPVETAASPATEPVVPAAKPPAETPAPRATAPATKLAPAAAKPARGPLEKNPAVPQGGAVLQVAALRSQADALALAEALQQKEYPAYVLTPATGNLYRVQVGPYTSAKAADAAKRALEREGFKTILKR